MIFETKNIRINQCKNGDYEVIRKRDNMWLGYVRWRKGSRFDPSNGDITVAVMKDISDLMKCLAIEKRKEKKNGK